MVAPFLMLDAEAVPLKSLIKPGRSEATLRRWNRQHRISRQSSPNAPLEFSMPAVVMVEHGDYETLEKLRAGDRSDPMVRRYFDLLGLPS
jgi:hypothetical protein